MIFPEVHIAVKPLAVVELIVGGDGYVHHAVRLLVGLELVIAVGGN